MSASNGTTVHLRVSVEAAQGSRKSMEDYTAVTLERRQDSECFFAVFDGHGGHQAAFFARQNLWKTIQKQKDFYSSDPNEVGKAIKRAFSEIHTAMWKERDSWPKTKYGTPSTAGTTASVVIMRGRHMYIANVGDSRVVLAQEDGEGVKAVPLTVDHKPEDPLEVQRIKSLGGQIGRSNGIFRVAWNRVSRIGQHRGPVLRSTKMESVPFLAIARSLGDLWSFNSFVGDFLVSPVPDVHYRLIDPRRDKFVVLASDGLWNAMRNKEVVHFVDNLEKNVFDMDWKDDVTHRLTCRALAKWRERNVRADNTSAIVVFFDEHEKAVAPYLPYSPPSDTETELGEATPSLSRSNSSTGSDSPDEGPQLKREFAFYNGSSLTKKHKDIKRIRSPALDSDTEREFKKIILSDD